MERQLAMPGEGHQARLTPVAGLTLDRLADRMDLLKRMDRMRRDLDRSRHMEAMDRFHQQASSILTSGKVAEALDPLQTTLQDTTGRPQYLVDVGRPLAKAC